MSVHISSLVWKDKGTTGNTRMLLLALADMANDEGICWPSVSTLRSRLNLGTDRAIQQILSNLESNGYIVKQQRSGHSNVYKINPGEKKPIYAAWAMTRGSARNNKKFGWLKRLRSEAQRGTSNGS